MAISWTDNDIYSSIKEVYKGDGSIQTGSCLEPLAGESPAWFKQRKLRAQQNNYLQTIVHSRYMPIFTSPIQQVRKCSTQLGRYYEVLDVSVDNAGTERDLFMRNGAEITALLNRAFIVSDNYPLSDIEQYNTEEQLKKRVMPFFNWVQPDAVAVEYTETDVFGSLTQFAYYFYLKSINYGMDFKVMKVYSTEGIEIKTMMWIGKDGKPTDEEGEEAERIKEFDSFMPNDMYEKYGELPVRMVKYTDNLNSNDILTTPNTLSIAKTCYCIYVRQSETEMTLAKNNLALLVMPGDDVEKVDTGNDTVLLCSPDGNVPFYLAPDLQAIDKSYMMTEKDIENMYRQEGQHYATGTASQSGLSKEMDNIIVNNQLSFLSQELKFADEWIDLWFARWLGKEKELQSTTALYPLSFNKRDIAQHLETLGALLDVGGNEIDEVKKIVLQDIAEEAFKGKKPVLDAIKEVINKWIPSKEVDFNAE